MPGVLSFVAGQNSLSGNLSMGFLSLYDTLT